MMRVGIVTLVLLIGCGKGGGGGGKKSPAKTLAQDAAAPASETTKTKATTDAGPEPVSDQALLAALPAVDFVPKFDLGKVAPDAKKKARKLNVAGLRLHNRKKYGKARVKYEQALAANPGHVFARYNLSCVYALTAEPKKGLALLLELAKKPDCNSCKRALARALDDTDWKKYWDNPAFKALVAVFKIEPRCPDVKRASRELFDSSETYQIGVDKCVRVRLGGQRRGWYVIASGTRVNAKGEPVEWGDDPDDSGQDWANVVRFITSTRGKLLIPENGDAPNGWLAMSLARVEVADLNGDGVDEILVWGTYGTDGMSMAIEGVGIYGVNKKENQLARLLAIQLEPEPVHPGSGEPDPPTCAATLTVIDTTSGRELRLTSKSQAKTPSDWSKLDPESPLLSCRGNGTYALRYARGRFRVKKVRGGTKPSK